MIFSLEKAIVKLVIFLTITVSVCFVPQILNLPYFRYTLKTHTKYALSVRGRPSLIQAQKTKFFLKESPSESKYASCLFHFI